MARGARYNEDGVDNGGNLTTPIPAIPNIETFELEYPILYNLRKRAI